MKHNKSKFSKLLSLAFAFSLSSAALTGCKIENLFVFGFGLDLDEKCRNLKDIYYITK